MQLRLYLVEARFDTIFERRQEAISNGRADDIGELTQRNQFLVAALDLGPKPG